MKHCLLPLLCCTFLSHQAQCCECPNTLLDLPLQEMGWAQTRTSGIAGIADLVFSGVLLEVKKVKETRQNALFFEEKETLLELTFQLIKSYKGDKRDILKIRTNYGSEACGFSAPQGSTCLIFAEKGKNGFYYTYRSDCCKSIAKAYDEKRYHKYITFLESMTNMTDGDYVFYQSQSYWKGGSRDTVENMEAIRYSIKNGKFEGLWKVTDRKGRILEKGRYKNGQKTATWNVISYMESDLPTADQQIQKEKITFWNGQPKKSTMVIEDVQIMWEEPFGLQTVQKQRMKKKTARFIN